jgi:lysozyme
MMQLGAKGKTLIQSFETIRLKAYQDQHGIFTCGWGHTGPDVNAYTVCTMEQADAWFLTDTENAVRATNHVVTIPLTQNEFDALVSFTFNVGVGAEAHSTLIKLLNTGTNNVTVGDQFLVWNHVEGVANLGLTRRRCAERALFLLP